MDPDTSTQKINISPSFSDEDGGGDTRKSCILALLSPGPNFYQKKIVSVN